MGVGIAGKRHRQSEAVISMPTLQEQMAVAVTSLCSGRGHAPEYIRVSSGADKSSEMRADAMIEKYRPEEDKKK